MAYDKEILAEALRDLEEKRQMRERTLQTRQREIYEVLPQILKIDSELKSTAATAIRAAFDKGEDPAKAIERLKAHNLYLQQERRNILLQNGYPSDYLSPQPDCMQCQDMGYVGTALCSCMQAHYAERLTRRLSTVLPIDDQNFETFNYDYYSTVPDSRFHDSPRNNIEYNFDECSDYARHFGKHHKNLLLFGSSGLGKTFLSTCIAKTVSEKGFSVAYDTAITILSCFETEKFGGSSVQDARQQIKKYMESDLLIIDDLGTELTTAFTISVLYNLINGRLMASKSMIINTNLQPTDIAKRYSPAIASRISGEFTHLRFFGDDIRLIKKQKRI